MIEKHENEPCDDSTAGKQVTRREFLRLAGIAGAVVGVGGGLGGLLAACGGTTTTSAGGASTTASTAGGTTTSGSATTASSVAGSSTTAAANAEVGRGVKIGWVSMATGPFAGLGEPDPFLLEQAKKAIGDGLVCADNKKHPITWIYKDSQSDTNRTAEVTGQLITSDKPDIVTGGMTPVVSPVVGTQCESNGVPCVTYGCPMEPWFVAMGGNMASPKPFNWAYNAFFSVGGDLNPVYVGLLNLVSTNKKVACLWPNDPDGTETSNEKTGMPPALKAAGYTVVNPGLFTQGQEDFSSVINKFKSEGCECLLGTWNPPDFANFWKQAIQQGFNPKATAIARAILTRPDMDAVGDIANGLCLEVWWEKTWPFKSSLTGLTCQGIVDAWNTANPGKPYTPALGLTGGACQDLITDIIKRTANLDDPKSYVDAIKATNLSTILGPIKFDAPLPNCARTPLVGGQWIGKVGAWERFVVDNSHYPSINKTADIKDRSTLPKG
jgi:branched-chain amino acid transport system substrate-binding protein